MQMGRLGTRSCALRSLEEAEMDIYVSCGIDRAGARSYHRLTNI